MTVIEANATQSDESIFLSAKIERALRLWAGLILMIFVTSHLINHAIGLFGVAAMSEVQEWRLTVWRSWPGTVLLVGAVGVHVVLVLKRILGRRTWRMPKFEALQIILGVLIPIVLVRHVVGTRVLSSMAQIDDSYVNVLRFLWPNNALWQTIALLVVWTHGVIGLYFVCNARAWFIRWKTVCLLTVVIIPTLALAGFISAGREAATVVVAPEAWTSAQSAAYASANSVGRMVVFGFLIFLVLSVGARTLQLRLRPTVAVRFTGHGEVKNPKGLTLLEMSRRNQIPHPSNCGGKGRCASCRVLILSGLNTLAVPTGLERKMLDYIRAPQQVRLACQIRPTQDLRVRILLPNDSRSLNRTSIDAALEWGIQRPLTVLFADIRGFSALAGHQMPSDTAVLLNRVIDELTQATLAHGGRVALIETDGIMAAFGLSDVGGSGARSAVKAAADMLRAIALVNEDLGATLPQPLRIGIGIHSGPVVVTQIGDSERGFQLVVIGEAVVAASRLEEATKEMAADCIVSCVTLKSAGFPTEGKDVAQIHYKNGEEPLSAVMYPDLSDLLKTVAPERRG